MVPIKIHSTTTPNQNFGISNQHPKLMSAAYVEYTSQEDNASRAAAQIAGFTYSTGSSMLSHTQSTSTQPSPPIRLVTALVQYSTVDASPFKLPYHRMAWPVTQHSFDKFCSCTARDLWGTSVDVYFFDVTFHQRMMIELSFRLWITTASILSFNRLSTLSFVVRQILFFPKSNLTGQLPSFSTHYLVLSICMVRQVNPTTKSTN